MNTKKEFGIHFGILCNKISVQCLAQGYTLGDNANRIDSLAESINHLYFSNIITERDMNKCNDRLFKMIKKYVKPYKDNNHGNRKNKNQAK